MALYERDGDGVAVESFENFHLPREGFFDERRGGILFAHLASVDPVGTFCEGKCIGGAGRNLAVESRDGSDEEQCDCGKSDAAEVHEHNDSDSGIVYSVG